LDGEKWLRRFLVGGSRPAENGHAAHTRTKRVSPGDLRRTGLPFPLTLLPDSLIFMGCWHSASFNSTQ
jgi:hypothetical protein